MDHSVITRDECHEGNESSAVIEDYKVWWAASVAFKLEAGGKGDKHAGTRVLDRGNNVCSPWEKREQVGFGELKGCQNTGLWCVRKTVAWDKVGKVAGGRSCWSSCDPGTEFRFLSSVQWEASKDFDKRSDTIWFLKRLLRKIILKGYCGYSVEPRLVGGLEWQPGTRSSHP